MYRALSIVSVCYWRWEAGITNSFVYASRQADRWLYSTVC